MTTATFKTEDDKFFALIGGHSGYEERGKDIVCAACSCLAYTLLNSICMIMGGIEQVVHINALDNDGDEKPYFYLSFRTKTEEERVKAETIFETIKCGFSLLHEQYPEYVNLTVD